MKVKILKNCPSCNSDLIRIKDQLFCKNKTCPAINYKQVINYAKVLKIKGLGEKTIEKLSLKSISDIYYLTEDNLHLLL